MSARIIGLTDAQIASEKLGFCPHCNAPVRRLRGLDAARTPLLVGRDRLPARYDEGEVELILESGKIRKGRLLTKDETPGPGVAWVYLRHACPSQEAPAPSAGARVQTPPRRRKPNRRRLAWKGLGAAAWGFICRWGVPRSTLEAVVGRALKLAVIRARDLQPADLGEVTDGDIPLPLLIELAGGLTAQLNAARTPSQARAVLLDLAARGNTILGSLACWGRLFPPLEEYQDLEAMLDAA